MGIPSRPPARRKEARGDFPVATCGRKTHEGEARPEHAQIRRALLNWFRANARTLPWRGTGDPYAVWVSEIMLQQTQVATVVPFYQRFMQAYPSVKSLAQSPLERVLELWSGLGYYRRARHLHEAARVIWREHGGDFPQNYAGIRALPGIGDYTAKAVLSIAFNQPHAVLDGNVARVVARLGCLRGNLHQPRFRESVEASLAQLLSRRQAGNFNQAMMELGQTICKPRRPHCSICPLAKWCAGHRSGNPEAYPLPRPRRAAQLHHLAVGLLRYGKKVAMVRGLGDGLLDDLWNFPSAFGRSSAGALENLREKLAALFGNHPDISARHGVSLQPAPLAEFQHNITFRAIRGRIYQVTPSPFTLYKGVHWFELSRLPQAAISQLARKIVQKISRL